MIGGFNKLPFLERQMELFCLHGMRFFEKQSTQQQCGFRTIFDVSKFW